MNKTDSEIIAAIEKAKPGISKYLALMDRLYSADVSSDADFQRMYNDFYKMRQRPKEWYEYYYELLENSKKRRPPFKDVLESIHTKFDRCEPSFSSKLSATLDPWKPIWDKHVLENIGPVSDGDATTKTDIAVSKYTEINKVVF